MPDTFTPNMNLCKPAVGSIDWDTKINGNYDLIDPLEARVANLESMHGGGVPGYWIMPIGSTWDDFVNTYNSAGSGDTIMLPNETIIQTAFQSIVKSITILGHPGGLSNLKCVNTLINSGSAQRFFIGYGSTPIHVRFSGFTLEDDRATVPRETTIFCGHNVASCEIDHMTFKNITANCFQTYDTPADPLSTFNISFHHNTINEWYESVFIIGEGHSQHIRVYDNVGFTSGRNPNLSVSPPYGIAVDIENSGGYVSDVVIVGNSFDGSGVTDRSKMLYSFGIVMSKSNTTTYTGYGNVTIAGNYLKGWNKGIAVQFLNDFQDGKIGEVWIEKNKIEQYDLNGVVLNPSGGGGVSGWGTTDDTIALLSNEVIGPDTGPIEDYTYTPSLNVIKSKNKFHT